MARARLLKPGFFSNEKLTEIPPYGRLLFAGLWTIADRKGRLPDRAKWIKGALFPYENVAVDRLLSDLEAHGFIQRYEAQSERYIQVINFEKHQSPHKNEAASTIPAPEEHASTRSNVGSAPAVAVAVPIAIADSGARVLDAPSVGAPPDPEDSDGGFYRQWFKRYEQEHAGPPSPNEKAAARKLERDFGTEACIAIASDHDWERHPNWLRKALEDPKHDNRRRTANGVHHSEPDSADEAPDHPYGDMRPKFVSPRRRLLDAGGASDG